MRTLLKSIVVYFLAFFARAVVRRYRPKIVMVTGSVGKTSTKDAVAVALAAKFFVRKSEKSFNSDFGVPFTILGVGNPWQNPLKWLIIVKSALALLILPNHYPNLLVLEVGADKPGDLARILKIATPDAVIVTRLPKIPVHVEAYTSPEHVREEEFSPAYALSASAPLIVPADDGYALSMAVRTPARVITYGIMQGAVVVSDVRFYEHEGKVAGMKANIKVVDEEQAEIVIKGAVGKTQVLPAAAALAVARAFGISMKDALSGLTNYEPPFGRGRLFAGKNGSVIIDDSYNSSPVAVEEALQTLKAFPNAKRRIAVLGDMLELGRYSVMEHERIGTLAHDSSDLVVSVGVRARAFATAQGTTTGRTETMQFDTAKVAGPALAELLKEGDVVLIKGSQSIRTERIVEALLANPADAAHLVRQERAWLRRA